MNKLPTSHSSLTSSPSQAACEVISCAQRKHSDRRASEQIGFVWEAKRKQVTDARVLMKVLELTPSFNRAPSHAWYLWRQESSPRFRLPHTPGSCSPADSGRSSACREGCRKRREYLGVCICRITSISCRWWWWWRFSPWSRSAAGKVVHLPRIQQVLKFMQDSETHKAV